MTKSKEELLSKLQELYPDFLTNKTFYSGDISESPEVSFPDLLLPQIFRDANRKNNLEAMKAIIELADAIPYEQKRPQEDSYDDKTLIKNRALYSDLIFDYHGQDSDIENNLSSVQNFLNLISA